MTKQTQPTDAELIPCPFCGAQPDECEIGQFVVECPSCAIVGPASDNSNAARRAWNTRWGTPAWAGEPDFYTACAWHEGGGEAGWIPLPGYSNETEHGVKHLVLEAARKEGYKGTAAGRLLELGWEIRPVYLAPQPTQAQAGAVPLTDEQIKDEASHHGFVGSTEMLVKFVRGIEAAHGIKGGQHGTDT